MFSIPAALKSPIIRACILTIFFFGFSGAATSPYKSIIGISELGLSNGFYAVLILFGSILNVVVSVTVGVVADRAGRYRALMLGVIAFGILGFGLVFAIPTQFVFVFTSLVLLPVFGSLNALLFATIRATTNRMGTEDATAVNATARAFISLSWILVPGIVAFLLVGARSMLPAYLIASLACVACFAFVFFMPSSPEVADPVLRRRFTYLASFGEVVSPRIAVRLIALGLICSMLYVNDTVLPLVLTQAAGGKVTDIGAVVGIVALLEVVFMIVWARIQRHIRPVTALATGAAIYALYLALLGFASAPWHLYALTLISGFGAAAIISIPITYAQDLIGDRPGLGSSLISVNMFVSGGLGAAFFAVGTAISTYSGTALLGSLGGLSGVALLVFLDGRRRVRRSTL